MNAPAFIDRKYGARYRAWQLQQTSDRRDEMAALMVRHLDADFRLRLIRAAVADLSGYAHGHDTIIDGIGLIRADLDAEDDLHLTARGA